MNIEREFPLHVAIWNNDTEKLALLIKENKVRKECFFFQRNRIHQGIIYCDEQ
jgi:hypothetical protein